MYTNFLVIFAGENYGFQGGEKLTQQISFFPSFDNIPRFMKALYVLDINKTVEPS